MISKYVRLFRFGREQVLMLFRRPDSPDNSEELAEFDDFISADMTLGLAAQSICKTRDDLVAYTWDAQLVPYLRCFLNRRGWLDEDWGRRLDRLDEEFRRLVN